jgi:molybdenum cofactor biosynthesis protein MoaC
MRDISSKIHTLRIATASAEVHMSASSAELVKENKGPKQDVLPIARAAAFLAVKNTPNVIPHCHPLPVEAVAVDYVFSESFIRILVTAKTIYKTGCEVEAMHGASVAALTIYDMLKPVDDHVFISSVRLEEKTGGKSDWGDVFETPISVAVLVTSDSVSSGKKVDKAGKAVMKKLMSLGLKADHFEVIPDEAEKIATRVLALCESGVQLILTCGGTGLGPRDVTVEAVRPLLTREIPGMMEAARAYGQERMPYAMLSRGVAGLRERALIITLPGSTGGATETMDAIFPYALHVFKVLEKGYRHLDG